jgi:hypothetical protein
MATSTRTFASQPLFPSDTEEAVTHGSFVWNELYTGGVEAAKAFYAARTTAASVAGIA